MYVYSSFNMNSECSGQVQLVKFCYAYHRQDGEGERDIVTILLWRQETRRVEEVIPIIVNTTHCENDDTFLQDNYRFCCVQRPINTSNPNLDLQVVRGNPLGFQLAVRTSAGLSGILLLEAPPLEDECDAYGYTLPTGETGEFGVGSTIPLKTDHPQFRGIISFITRGTYFLLLDPSGPHTTTHELLCVAHCRMATVQ